MIGIVGGVGPLAGLDIMRKIIEETKANKDQEHLPVLLSSQPHRIADRTAYLMGDEQKNPASALTEIIVELAAAGATVAAIPCNTAHAPAIFGIIQERLATTGCNIKLLNLITETVSYIKNEYGKISVGVLCTTGTQRTGLYRKALEAQGLRVIEPDLLLQQNVHQAIYNEDYGIKAFSSPVTDKAKSDLTAAIGKLKEQGAEIIILGCTELPLALPQQQMGDLMLIDPNRILARALIREINPDKLK